jgi:hypothetical protein
MLVVAAFEVALTTEVFVSPSAIALLTTILLETTEKPVLVPEETGPALITEDVPVEAVPIAVTVLDVLLALSVVALPVE